MKKTNINKAVSAVVNRWIAIAAKGVKGILAPMDSSMDGKELSLRWTTTPNAADDDHKLAREYHAKGKAIAPVRPDLAFLDYGQNCAERGESARSYTVRSAMSQGLVKVVDLIGVRDGKQEPFKAIVHAKFDPAKGLAGKSATDNYCQFIVPVSPVFGIVSYVETRAIRGGRNEATLIKINVPSTKTPKTSGKPVKASQKTAKGKK